MRRLQFPHTPISRSVPPFAPLAAPWHRNPPSALPQSLLPASCSKRKNYASNCERNREILGAAAISVTPPALERRLFRNYSRAFPLASSARTSRSKISWRAASAAAESAVRCLRRESQIFVHASGNQYFNALRLSPTSLPSCRSEGSGLALLSIVSMAFESSARSDLWRSGFFSREQSSLVQYPFPVWTNVDGSNAGPHSSTGLTAKWCASQGEDG